MWSLPLCATPTLYRRRPSFYFFLITFFLFVTVFLKRGQIKSISPAPLTGPVGNYGPKCLNNVPSPAYNKNRTSSTPPPFVWQKKRCE